MDAHDSMLLLQKYTHPELQPLTVEGDAETPLRRKLQAFRLWFLCAPKGESGRVSEPLPARMSHDLWPSDQQWAEALPSILVIPAFYSQVTPAFRSSDALGVNQDDERLQICGTFTHRRGS